MADKEDKKDDKKKESVKDPCAKIKMQAAAAMATGAVVGAFTYGIGTAAGAVTAAALDKKYAECKKKQAIEAEKLAQEEALKAEQARIASLQTAQTNAPTRFKPIAAVSGRKQIRQQRDLYRDVLILLGIGITLYVVYKAVNNQPVFALPHGLKRSTRKQRRSSRAA